MVVVLESTDTAFECPCYDLHVAKLLCLATCELVHRLEADIEAGLGHVNSHDVDRAVLVDQLPASTALGRVPAWGYGVYRQQIREMNTCRQDGPVTACMPPMYGKLGRSPNVLYPERRVRS